LAIIAAKVFDHLVSVQLRKITARTKNTIDDLLVDLLHGPAKVLALVGMLDLGLNFYHWPDFIARWLRNGFKFVLACSLTYLALKLVDLGAGYWANKTSARADKSFNDLLIPMVSKTFKGFVLVMAVLTTLDLMGFNIRTLLAGVSVSGLALGLAAQDTVGNLFGAAAVFIDKPFNVGDRIQLNGVDGMVEQMGLRSTRIRNLDGHLITVPNKTMGNATITNVSRRPTIKTAINIGVTYDTPAEKVGRAVAILDEIFKKHPMTEDLIIGFNQFADSSLNINVTHWWKGTDHRAYVAGLQDMNLAVKKRFDAEGIGFAFPSRTIFLKQDSEWRLGMPNVSQASQPQEDSQAARASSAMPQNPRV
ncbi:MAG TPA: mechanosensitive ion channel family protein, partial [Verrucomicrobiae bacterium]|nr:mechanosensitive ion channel family protein [Verrucomicrobiae bacterium]